MATRIKIDRELLAKFCRQNGIRRLSLFGSVLRDDFGPESDVDVLVDFVPGRVPGLLGMARLERQLTEIVCRKVDLRTPEDLSPYFRDRIQAEAEEQYAA